MCFHRILNWIQDRKVPPPKRIKQVDLNTIRDVVKRDCGDIPILIPDKYWYLATTESFLRFLEYDQTDKYTYIPDKPNTEITFDCVYEDEEILMDDNYKKIKDIEIGDEVLSYEFGNGYCIKPVVNKIKKGLLDGYKVTFKNHTSIIITKNHPMWRRVCSDIDKNPVEYKKDYLSNINLNNWKMKRVPCIKKVPYKKEDIEWLDEELCFVIGQYLADGWKTNNQIWTSGYAIHLIKSILDRHNIPYTEYKNSNNVPELYFKKSKFKDFLRLQKENSMDIHISKELKNLPENKLLSIIAGEFYGNGHISGNKYVISTSSKQFANDLREMSLKVGYPFFIRYKGKHGGLGNHPIYKVNYNPKGFSVKDYGHDNLSETSINNIEYVGKLSMYDITVKDTNTFFFKNGICTHNCNSFASVFHGNVSIPKWSNIPIGICWLSKPKHAVNIFVDENLKTWYLEPQNDSLWLVTDRKDWKPYIVWF